MRSSKGGNKQIELDSLEFLDAIASQEETHVTRSRQVFLKISQRILKSDKDLKSIVSSR